MALLTTLVAVQVNGNGRYGVTTAKELGMTSLRSINAEGHIVGGDGAGGVRLWDGRSTVEVTAGDSDWAEAAWLNNNDAIVGLAAFGAAGRQKFATFLVQGGVFTKLTEEVPSSTYFGAVGLNDAMHSAWSLADTSMPGRPATAGVFYDGHAATLLPDLGGRAVFPAGISSDDVVVGTAYLGDEAMTARAFVWSKGVMKDIAVSNEDRTYGSAINDHSVVGGFRDVPGKPRSVFIWSADRFSDVGRLKQVDDESLYTYSSINSINNWNVAIGEIAARPVIWRAGSLTQLNDAITFPANITKLVSVRQINDRGQIIGSASTPDGVIDVLLSPKWDRNSARLINVSARATARPGERSCILGLSVAGGARRILARGVGPTLSSLGVAECAQATGMSVYNGGALTNQNTGWSSGTNPGALLSEMHSAGAFPLPTGSADSAILLNEVRGVHTVMTEDVSGRDGVVLCELYDRGGDPDAKIVNASARVWVDRGNACGILGFVVKGPGTARVLLRAVGPPLSSLGVEHPLTNPILSLYRGETFALANDDWGDGTHQNVIARAAREGGAFALPDDGKDAALVVELEPGDYTMVVHDRDGLSGVVLLEIYLLD